MNTTRTYILIGGTSVLGLLLPSAVLAHCPLCTAGAGLVALGAYSIGVNGMTIGLLLGAFAIALGLWIARLIKKKYLPWQDHVIGVFSWLTTLFPLKVLLSEYTSLYINWNGSYGSLFNRTYPINLFLVGGVIGAVLMYIAPSMSKAITARRGETIRYQGIMITFALLILASLITQFTL